MTPESDSVPIEQQVIPGTQERTLPADVDKYAAWQDAVDRSALAREFRTAWATQQKEDRELRGKFARWLLWACSAKR